jgi:hypothetical protein
MDRRETLDSVRTARSRHGSFRDRARDIATQTSGARPRGRLTLGDAARLFRDVAAERPILVIGTLAIVTTSCSATARFAARERSCRSPDKRRRSPAKPAASDRCSTPPRAAHFRERTFDTPCSPGFAGDAVSRETAFLIHGALCGPARSSPNSRAPRIATKPKSEPGL